MLACRPMVLFALAAVGGVLTARSWPAGAALAPWGAVLFLGLTVRFFRGGFASGSVFTSAVASEFPSGFPSGRRGVPPEYLPHFLAKPGAVARRGADTFLIVACVFCFSLGLWRQGTWRAELSPARLPLGEWADAVLLADSPKQGGAGGRWSIAARVLEIGGAPAGEVPVRLYGTAKEAFRRGDALRARVRFSAPRPRIFPGAFDGALWLERDALAANANSRYGAPLAVLPAAPSLFARAMRLVDSVRAFAIGQTLLRGGEHGGMLAAMLYGHRGNLPRDVGGAFRRVGIGHVLAISGLHVGLVAGILWWLAGWLPCSPRGRALLCLAATIVYLGLSGGQTAAARATLMAVVHLGARALGRRSDMLNSLAAAAFFIVLHNPSAPLDLSFQLSFTAVVFIHIALSGWGRARGWFASPLRAQADGLVRLSLATSAGLFPIVAAAFNQVNPAGLPINVVVVPMMGTVLAGGLLLPLLGWIPGAALLLTLPSEALVRCAHFVDALPYSSFSAQSPPGLWMFVFYLCIFFSLLSGMIGGEAARSRVLRASLAGAGVAFIGMAAGMFSAPPPERSRAALLPGGSGLGVFIVEDPQGRITVVGEVRREGRTEAEWLHSLRRGGEAAVVSFGRGRRDALGDLQFHYPFAGEANHPLTRRREAGARPVWRPIGGAPGMEYAFLRDGRGRVVVLFVRCGGKMLASASAQAGAEEIAAAAAFWRESGGGDSGGTAGGGGIFAAGARRGVALWGAEGVRVYDGEKWAAPEKRFFLNISGKNIE